MALQIFCQRDSRWSDVKLGASTLTMGRFGCTTCCLAMLSSYFGKLIYPDEIAKNPNNYTKDGLIIWRNLNLDIKFVKRIYGFNQAEIDRSLKLPNTCVLLQVDNGKHWVVATSKSWIGGDYNIVDPWTGNRGSAKKNYYNITGSAHFIKK